MKRFLISILLALTLTVTFSPTVQAALAASWVPSVRSANSRNFDTPYPLNGVTLRLAPEYIHLDGNGTINAVVEFPSDYTGPGVDEIAGKTMSLQFDESLISGVNQPGYVTLVVTFTLTATDESDGKIAVDFYGLDEVYIFW